MTAGRLADRLLARGHLNARIVVGGASYLIAAALLLPALLSRRLTLGLPLLILAGAAFAARDPALDAARLDIMHHRLWGRAEAVRTLLRRVMVASAPLVFGFVADRVAPHQSAAPGAGFGADASAAGLHVAFLIMLVTLALGGILTFRAMRSYPSDVATAVASERVTGVPA